ncbi:MAG: alpha/beta fold hydrolase [Candidatus Sabulitectum sp.]|nr:alpha/beta fold hydrolase [Candidatus Sabulitectum sp.]
MKWKIIIAGVILVVLIAGVGLIYLYSMGKPLYKPGMVSAGENLRAPLTPPAQVNGDSLWKVEEDIQLHHFSAGEGRNILIIHGGPGIPSLEPWSGLEPLTGDYQFHYYDQRGCGRSTRPIDSFSSSNYYENLTTLDRTLGIGAQIADIERIRRILGDEKLILIGHSWGGFLASLYAAEFPEHIEAMILVAPADALVMSKNDDGGLFEEVRAHLPESMQDEYTAYLENYLDYKNIFTRSETDLVVLNGRFGEYYAAATGIALREQGETGGWMVHAMYFSMGLQHDYRDSLKCVTAPVLVIQGTDDLQSEQVSTVYVDALPNARFYAIENAAHMPFVDQPAEFAAVVSDFLTELE